jgi:hypothetical protein
MLYPVKLQVHYLKTTSVVPFLSGGAVAFCAMRGANIRNPAKSQALISVIFKNSLSLD